MLVVGCSGQVRALAPNPGPSTGSIGLEATIPSAPPTKAATIAAPGNGANFNSTPITVSGLCQTGLLVKLFDNSIFVGSVMCTNSSYSLQINLFSGRNDLIARVYDALDQSGPDSAITTVNFNDAQFTQFGSRVTLSSSYARLGADPGAELDWPLVIANGVGPYAISTDWGDGTPPTLQTQSFTGDFTVKHTYRSAGVYTVVVRATDANGTTAFLQLVGVGNGKVTQGTATTGTGTGSLTPVTKTTVIWWPVAVMIPFLIVSFWLGGRHELYSIRKHLEQSRNTINY